MRRLSWVLLLVCFLASGLYAQESPGAAKALKDGGAFEKDGKLDQALQTYQEAIKAGPVEELYRKAGSLLGKMQKYKEAETLVSEGIAKYPDSTSLVNLHGFIQLKMGSADEARKSWEKVLAKDPNNSFAKEQIAKMPESKPATTKNTEPETTMVTSVDGTESTPAHQPLPDKPASSLSPEEQEKLAQQLYQDMSQIEENDRESFIAAHRKVIDKCPATKWAEESCWRLSNLYWTNYDSPKFDEGIPLLEYLIKNYPNSEFVSPAKKRLIVAFKDTNNNEKLAGLYAEMFKRQEEFTPGEFRARALEYADALVALGKKEEAKNLYQEIVKRSEEKSDFNTEVEIAQEKLKGL